MIDLSVITSAAKAVLDAATLNASIERGERINYDPGRCPWIGIYPDAVQSAPLTVGAGGSRWQSTGAFQVVIQTSSFIDDGQDASDALESLAKSVCAAINADLSLGVAGFRITSVTRDYRYVVFDDDGNGTIFMPQVIIRFGFEYRSSGV